MLLVNGRSGRAAHRGSCADEKGTEMGHECQHGVPFKSTKVWNEACDRCREEEAAYDRATSRINAQLTKKHRNAFSPSPESMRAIREEVDDMLAAYEEGVPIGLGRIVRGRRRQAALQRAGAYGKKPEPRPALFGYMEWALEYRPERFTPAMREALELTYGQGLSQRKAAAASRWPCSRSSYRDRLAGAMRALRIVLLAEARVDGKRPSEVRRGRNAGRIAL